jgi:hypothetical protein
MDLQYFDDDGYAAYHQETLLQQQLEEEDEEIRNQFVHEKPKSSGNAGLGSASS